MKTLNGKIFERPPGVDARGEVRYSVRVCRFGDGYSQVVPSGLNNVVQSWRLRFRGNREEIRGIQTFLDGTRGSESFLWSPPLGPQGHYRLDATQGVTVFAHGGDLYTLETAFEEVFPLDPR